MENMNEAKSPDNNCNHDNGEAAPGCCCSCTNTTREPVESWNQWRQLQQPLEHSDHSISGSASATNQMTGGSKDEPADSKSTASQLRRLDSSRAAIAPCSRTVNGNHQAAGTVHPDGVCSYCCCCDCSCHHHRQQQQQQQQHYHHHHHHHRQWRRSSSSTAETIWSKMAKSVSGAAETNVIIQDNETTTDSPSPTSMDIQTTTLTINEKLKLQNKQRKYLILSMALEEMLATDQHAGDNHQSPARKRKDTDEETEEAEEQEQEEASNLEPDCFDCSRSRSCSLGPMRSAPLPLWARNSIAAAAAKVVEPTRTSVNELTKGVELLAAKPHSQHSQVFMPIAHARPSLPSIIPNGATDFKFELLTRPKARRQQERERERPSTAVIEPTSEPRDSGRRRRSTPGRHQGAQIEEQLAAGGEWPCEVEDNLSASLHGFSIKQTSQNKAAESESGNRETAQVSDNNSEAEETETSQQSVSIHGSWCNVSDLGDTIRLEKVCETSDVADNMSTSGPRGEFQRRRKINKAPSFTSDSYNFDLEAFIMESWLDDHPQFTREYFMRKASRKFIDDWLLAHARVGHTSLMGSQYDLKEGVSSGPLAISRSISQQSQVVPHLRIPTWHTIGGCSTAAAHDYEPPTRAQYGMSTFNLPRTFRSNSQSAGTPNAAYRNSGAITPIRKISATDFESRTGGNCFLRPMLSTTPDGRLTFLSQAPPVSPSPASAPSRTFPADTWLAQSKPKKHFKADEGEKQSADERQQTESLQASAQQTSGPLLTTTSDTTSLSHAAQSQNQTPSRDSEIELIFELVKNIYHDLDIRTLLHKILKNISILINADKSSLFLVCGRPGDPDRHLVSQLFNVDQDSAEVAEPGECIRIPWATGLVGYVAESGESVNIANCYEDPRFTNTIDQRTGYLTKHMLCAPIFDKSGEIVGVAQVINRRDGQPFSVSDEIRFKRYLQFCGVGLRNAQSYEHCQLENKRNQVLLDLARMVFEEQSTIEQVVYRIMLHTQSLLECQRCQVLLIEAGSEDIDGLFHHNADWPPQSTTTTTQRPGDTADYQDSRQAASWKPQLRKLSSDATAGRPSGSCDSAATGHDIEHNVECEPQQQPPKLFNLVFDLEYDGDEQNTIEGSARTNGFTFSNADNSRSQFPINIGITGYVAMTGETLNIEDAHSHPRFDPAVDQDTGFVHKSILCMPIRNGQRQIIGVSQLINKRNGKPFNKNDEDLFEAFAIFCGLGIHNTLMYERVLKVMAKQRVTFEVLSYHATAPLEEAKKLQQEQIPSCFGLNLASLKFNDFSLDDQYMLKSCLRFFLDLDLMRRFQIDQLVFCNWILSVQKNYRKVTYHPIVGGNGLKASPVRYHNWRHAFNVSQMMFAILVNTQVCRTLGELETLALLIACLCHDLDHRGTNNSFQIKSASPLAQLYSTSTMEHHHFDQCVMILNSQGNQILANLSPHEYSRVIVLLEEAILATDLANYFQKRDLFFRLVNSDQFDWHHDPGHRSLLRCMLMTACDIAAITKPWPVQKIVADLVMSEFYQQGDIEKNELKIEPIDMMNREKMSKLPEMQMGFIDTICAPIYSALAKLFPRELSTLLDGCLANRKLWAELAKQNEQLELPVASIQELNSLPKHDKCPVSPGRISKLSKSTINLGACTLVNNDFSPTVDATISKLGEDSALVMLGESMDSSHTASIVSCCHTSAFNQRKSV